MALADPTRRSIFERLVERPSAVSELARGLPVSRPAVSQHLKVLKDAGLVRDRRAGKQRIYSVDAIGLGAFRAELEQFWSKALAAYKALVEEPRRRSHEHPDRSRDVDPDVDRRRGADRARFSVFTEDFGSFKPPEHNMLGVEIAETVFEPRAGGHVYDRGVDGSECRWARVLAYEPPTACVLSWDISPHWQIETDLEKTSEVEVRFIAETPSARESNSSTATWTPRRRLGGRARRRRRRRRLAAVPGAIRGADQESGLT